MLYSLAGAVVIFICGIEISRRLNAKISKDHERVEKYILLLRYIKSQIDCFALPICDILGRSDSQLLLSCGWIGDMPPSALEEMLKEASVEDEEAQSILLEFCKDFGKSYLDEQIRRCDHYISLLEEFEFKQEHFAFFSAFILFNKHILMKDIKKEKSYWKHVKKYSLIHKW